MVHKSPFERGDPHISLLRSISDLILLTCYALAFEEISLLQKREYYNVTRRSCFSS
ncbi:hypothetical protein CP10139811_0756 [Chlamydia ibidis]|uniref:Uncharacterized protein n=2 Tax=Chlamydia ibidis TaxID=1405396 RepID=S7KK90_9CHLA|nr:hypothetical protein CP10139811_0756 [Chlamydia ibidis]EQM63098.1 hypothetical protein H359_0076 [Chlamydia ibidis 10-1398/6]